MRTVQSGARMDEPEVMRCRNIFSTLKNWTGGTWPRKNFYKKSRCFREQVRIHILRRYNTELCARIIPQTLFFPLFVEKTSDSFFVL